MEIKNKNTLDSSWVPMKKIRKFVDDNKLLDDNAHISFEFLMTMCFPTIYDSVMQYARDCYTQGYLVGLKEKK